MSKTAAAFSQAWQDYRRHFRPLVTASALLMVPTIAIILGRRLLAGYTDLPASPQSDGVLGLVDFVVQIVSGGAVALLAADLRAGGTWGWRESWSRALARMRPLVTGNLVGIAMTCLLLTPIFGAIVLVVVCFAGAPGGVAPSIRLVVGASGALIFCASPVVGLLPFVSAIERVGGLGTAGAAWRILRKDLRRNVLTVGLAQALVLAPNFALMFSLLDSPWLRALSDVFTMLVSPFVVLVTLSVYWEARDAGGAGGAQLRAALDA